MERHGSSLRRSTKTTCTVETGIAKDDDDEIIKKKTRRRRFLFLRRECLQRTQSPLLRPACIVSVSLFLLLRLACNITILSHSTTTRQRSSPPVLSIPRVSGDIIMRDAGYTLKPRELGYYVDESDTLVGVETLDHMTNPHVSLTSIQVSTRDLRVQEHVKEASQDYYDGMRDAFEEGDCRAQYEWQKASFPTCNLLHEHDLGLLPNKRKVKMLGHGYWRDVWRVLDGRHAPVVLKTLRYEHDWEDRNYDRHRRDAVAMLRLSASPNIIDIYSYCGNSGMFEYASGGDMEDMIWPTKDETKWSSTEKLVVAYQVATALSDVHDVEGNGRPSIAHTDITTSQFVLVNGRYKLNDFNRCRFIAWNKKTNEQCGFHVGNNPGHFRSPEEYNYETETEKVDIYSMGNVFYVLLTETWPFNNDDSDEVEILVKMGKRPHVSKRLRDSTDPAIETLRTAMTLCWRQDPKSRPTAAEVANLFRGKLKELNVRVNK